MSFLGTKQPVGEPSHMSNGKTGSRLHADAILPSAGGTSSAGITGTETPPKSTPSSANPGSRSNSRKRHSKTESKDRGAIATCMEMIQIKLDALPMADRIMIISELTRRLAARLYTDGQKLQEQRQKNLDLK